MKKHIRKIIFGVLILALGLFIWNDSLYDRKPVLPLEAEQVKFMCCYPENFDSSVDSHLEIVSDTNKDIILNALQDMDLVADTDLQNQVAKSGQPWWGTELCKVDIHLNKDFWNRTSSVKLYLFDDGHVMINCTAPHKPYPEYVSYDREYSYLRYYKAQAENYNELAERICAVRDIYSVNYPL